MQTGNEIKNIPIVFSSDDEYAIYIPIVIASIKENANCSCYYNIYILDSNIDKDTKKIISNYVNSLGNFSVNYIDVSAYIEKYKELWFVVAHYSVATYIRFFLPEIFPSLDKMIYLDIDVLVRDDISELFDINIDDFAVGAAVDPCYEHDSSLDTTLQDYNKNIMHYPEDYKVFNAGILLVNLSKWRELNITEKCIHKLKELKKPRVLDQCILNTTFCNGLVYPLSPEWNYQWHADIESINYPTDSPKINSIVETYRKAKDHIKIIHYTTSIKPWNIYSFKKITYHDCKVEKEYMVPWWETARRTPFYEKITLNNAAVVLDKVFNTTHYHLLGIIKIQKDETKNSITVYLFGFELYSKIKNSMIKKISFCKIPILTKERKRK